MKSRAMQLVGLFAGLIGFALLGLGLHVSPRRAAFAYLVAFVFAFSTAVGALFLAMITRVARATWFVVLRRPAQAIYATLPLFALLFIPIVLGLRWIYPWAQPLDTLDRSLREAIAMKRAWLSPGFFTARAVVYLGVWITLAELLRRWSVRHDEAPGPVTVGAERTLSAAGLPALMLTLTFASFDWMMSLEPAWSSNMYGVYVLAAGFFGGSGALGVLAWATATHELEGIVREDHTISLGKVMLSAVMSWAYIAFVQFLILWLADLPEEVVWYRSRVEGSWLPVAWLLPIAHFAVPFIALLFRSVKRSAFGLGTVGLWMLVFHYVDSYWLVMPALAPTGWRPHWLDLAAVLAVCGPVGAFASWRFRTARPLPIQDPSLADALRYHAS